MFYLESRIQLLESLLEANGLAKPPADDFAVVPGPPEARFEQPALSTPAAEDCNIAPELLNDRGIEPGTKDELVGGGRDTASSHQFAGPGHRATTSAISFASIVYAAVKRSMTGNTPSERGHVRPSRHAMSSSTGHNDSFFGLYAPPTVAAAPFPDRTLANRLSDLYFEHAIAEKTQVGKLASRQDDDLGRTVIKASRLARLKAESGGAICSP